MRVLLTVFISMAPFVVGQSVDVNSNIPKWLAESETYGVGVHDLDQVQGTCWKFITHCPDNEMFLREAKVRGIKTFPYLTFYQLPINVSYTNIRLMDHTDWILINESGEWVRSCFWEPEDHKNWYSVCPNVKEYADAILKNIEDLMKKGASGFFLDNIWEIPDYCYGDQLGKHKHMFSSQKEAFADLIRRARLIVKKYDPDGAVLINSGFPTAHLDQYWPLADAGMIESYICTWISDKRQSNWHKDWNGKDKMIPPGKQICTLSYIGYTQNPLKDDLYFCYASARLMNFIWNAGCEPRLISDPDVKRIYALTIGQPTTEEKIEDEIHYRIFRNGIVAVNPTDQEKYVKIKQEWIPTHSLYDHYHDSYIDLANGEVNLQMPPQSGRVWLFKISPEAFQKYSQNKHSYILTVNTEPGLGKTWFEVDGVPFITHCGLRKVEYVKGGNYGCFTVEFDSPGWHVIKVLDEQVHELLVPASYSTAFELNQLDIPGVPDNDKQVPEQLGKLMDPVNPQELPTGKPYLFTEWSGALSNKEKEIKLYVDKNMSVTAQYEQK